MSGAGALGGYVILALAMVICVWVVWLFIAGFHRTIRGLGTAKTPSDRKWLCLKLSGYSFLSAAFMVPLTFGIMLLNSFSSLKGFPYLAMLVIFGALWLIFSGYMVLNLARAYRAWREEKASGGRGLKRD